MCIFFKFRTFKTLLTKIKINKTSKVLEISFYVWALITLTKIRCLRKRLRLMTALGFLTKPEAFKKHETNFIYFKQTKKR